MIVRESTKYKRSYKDTILKKKKYEEQEKIERLIEIMITFPNLHNFMISQYKEKYHVEQKKANLKKFFTARINKLRLIFKPVSEYPYNYVEIDEIELIEVNDDHYKNL